MTTYTDWLASVKALLAHPDAINCVIDDKVLMLWHETGDTADMVASRLNQRYRRGYEAETELGGTSFAPTEKPCYN